MICGLSVWFGSSFIVVKWTLLLDCGLRGLFCQNDERWGLEGVFCGTAWHATGLNIFPPRRLSSSRKNPRRRSLCSICCRSPTHQQPPVTPVPFSDGQSSAGSFLLLRVAVRQRHSHLPVPFSFRYVLCWSYSRVLDRLRSDSDSIFFFLVTSATPAHFPALRRTPSSSGGFCFCRRSPLSSCSFSGEFQSSFLLVLFRVLE